jgi:hypothetical protein
MATAQRPNRDLISLTLAPFRQSLRLYAEVQRSALEAFARLGSLGTNPFLSGFGDSSDPVRSRPAGKRDEHPVGAMAAPAAERATRSSIPAAKRPIAAKPAATKRPATAKRAATKAAPAKKSAAAKPAPKTAVKSAAPAKTAAGKTVAAKPSRPRNTGAGAPKKA